MEFLNDLVTYVIPFIVVLTVLVFVHELGHYWAARYYGVGVEIFSIGFGREIYGWHDRAGTRWKISWIPLGGYVKFVGDSDVIGRTDESGEAGGDMTPEEKARSYHLRPVGQRSVIAAAGPLANFAFAIVVIAGMFMALGQPYTPAEVVEVVPGTAAEEAGFQPGDVVVEFDGAPIDRFEDFQNDVRMNFGTAAEVVVLRDGERVRLTVTPRLTEITDGFGNSQTIGRVGVIGVGTEIVRRNPVTALYYASIETWDIARRTLYAVGQMIAGTRDTRDLGGPLRIGQISGQMAQISFAAILWFTVVLSINLGLINLFPIPVLDGGHLLYYFFEAILGRPLSEQLREFGFRVGLAMVLTLFVFFTWNDIVRLQIFQ